MRVRFSLVVAAIVALSSGACDMHRWAYIQIRSVPAGATVQSEGLPSEYQLKKQAVPAGQYLPCTPIEQKADVVVPVTHWTYILKKAQYNDEKLFVERSAVAPFCAETKEDAKAKPYVLRGKMVSITSEKGLQNTVSITSTPSGASIYDVGTKELLGKTPTRVTFTFFAPYKVGRLIQLRLPGYKPEQRTVQVRSINLHVQLIRPGEKKRPVAPPPKKKKTKPAPAGTTANPGTKPAKTPANTPDKTTPKRPVPTRPAAPTTP